MNAPRVAKRKEKAPRVKRSSKKKSNAKDTTEGYKAKNNNDICPTPNKPEDRSGEITNKEKGVKRKGSWNWRNESCQGRRKERDKSKRTCKERKVAGISGAKAGTGILLARRRRCKLSFCTWETLPKRRGSKAAFPYTRRTKRKTPEKGKWNTASSWETKCRCCAWFTKDTTRANKWLASSKCEKSSSWTTSFFFVDDTKNAQQLTWLQTQSWNYTRNHTRLSPTTTDMRWPPQTPTHTYQQQKYFFWI